MSSYELSVTSKCNWNCKYCLVDTHQNYTDFKKVIKTVKELPRDCSVTLSGGEPGMLNRIEIEELLSILIEKNITIDLLTNGLFIKKYPELLKNIDEIIYHCVEDFEDEIELPDLKINNLFYSIVVSTEDIDKDSLKKFLIKYDKKFLINANAKPNERIDLNKFLKFIKDNEQYVHPRTKKEFLRNISK